MADETPTDRLNSTAKLLSLTDRVDHNSGALAREWMIANILHELARRLNKPVLTMPGKK